MVGEFLSPLYSIKKKSTVGFLKLGGAEMLVATLRSVLTMIGLVILCLGVAVLGIWLLGRVLNHVNPLGRRVNYE